jgi:hypothetical protein
MGIITCHLRAERINADVRVILWTVCKRTVKKGEKKLTMVEEEEMGVITNQCTDHLPGRGYGKY